MTPFQALVHRKPPLGLTELGIPIEAIDTIWSEEDIERVTEEINTTLSRPEVYDNLTEVHYYERQHSVIPLYSDPSDIYIWKKYLFLPLQAFTFSRNTPTPSAQEFRSSTNKQPPSTLSFYSTSSNPFFLTPPLHHTLRTHQNALNVTTRLQEHIAVQDPA